MNLKQNVLLPIAMCTGDYLRELHASPRPFQLALIDEAFNYVFHVLIRKRLRNVIGAVLLCELFIIFILRCAE